MFSELVARWDARGAEISKGDRLDQDNGLEQYKWTVRSIQTTRECILQFPWCLFYSPTRPCQGSSPRDSLCLEVSLTKNRITLQPWSRPLVRSVSGLASSLVGHDNSHWMGDAPPVDLQSSRKPTTGLRRRVTRKEILGAGTASLLSALAKLQPFVATRHAILYMWPHHLVSFGNKYTTTAYPSALGNLTTPRSAHDDQECYLHAFDGRVESANKRRK